jgi:hypothetical protein
MRLPFLLANCPQLVISQLPATCFFVNASWREHLYETAVYSAVAMEEEASNRPQEFGTRAARIHYRFFYSRRRRAQIKK